MSTAQSGNSSGAEMMIVAECQATAGATPVGSFNFASEQWTGMSIALNAYTISTNAVTGTSCPVGSATFVVDHDLGSSSGTLELVDPSGAVLTTQAYTASTGTLTLTFTPTTSGAYIVRDQATPSIQASEIF